MSKRNVSFAEFEQVVKQLPGHSAWGSRAGSSVGAIFTLQFGPTLAGDERWGEFSLMVYCAWRIVEGEKILCSWHEDADEALAPALKNLQGLEVQQAELTVWGDLLIQFTTGQALHIWNDAPFEIGSNSWSLGYQNQGFYGADTRNEFTYEPVA